MDKKELARRSLDEKWLPIQKLYKEFLNKKKSFSCPFCVDVNMRCDVCRINKQICNEDNVHLYNDYIDLCFKLEGKISVICDELEKMVE